jgi:hypothetical protein
VCICPFICCNPGGCWCCKDGKETNFHLFGYLIYLFLVLIYCLLFCSISFVLMTSDRCIFNRNSNTKVFFNHGTMGRL